MKAHKFSVSLGSLVSHASGLCSPWYRVALSLLKYFKIPLLFLQHNPAQPIHIWQQLWDLKPEILLCHSSQLLLSSSHVLGAWELTLSAARSQTQFEFAWQHHVCIHQDALGMYWPWCYLETVIISFAHRICSSSTSWYLPQESKKGKLFGKEEIGTKCHGLY